MHQHDNVVFHFPVLVSHSTLCVDPYLDPLRQCNSEYWITPFWDVVLRLLQLQLLVLIPDVEQESEQSESEEKMR